MQSIVKGLAVSAILGIALVSTAHAQAIDLTNSEKFVPRGHSYDSSNRNMPTLNSYEDQTDSRTDVLETEIYKHRRDRAFWDTWVNSTHGTYLGAEPRLVPDY